MHKFPVLFLLIFTVQSASAQSYAFGVKGGLAIGSQRWNDQSSAQNSLLFAPQGDLFIEQAPEDATSVMYAQVGMHVRGSAFRFRSGVGIDLNGQQVEYKGFTQAFKFNNIGLTVGVKRRGVLGKERAYYAVGLRGEYTLSTNLSKDNTVNVFTAIYPTNNFVRKWNGGLSLASGYEIPFSDLAGAFIEFSAHTDVTRQYFQPPLTVNWRDPYTGQIINTIAQRSIRNLSFEVSIGFRFLRKVVYLD